MVQLSILTATQRRQVPVAHFPFRVGRASGMDLRMEEPGVWAEHFHLESQGPEGVLLVPEPQALTLVNGQRAEARRLRMGDVIEAGSVRLTFAIAPARPGRFRVREALVWTGLAALALGQLLLISWVLP
jgi:hypothetical protein